MRRRRPGASVQAALLVAATAASQLLVAFSYILVAREVPPDSFGQVAAAIALGTAMVGIADFGANSLWVRALSSGELSLATAGHRAFWKVAVAVALATATGLITVLSGASPVMLAIGPVFVSATVAQLLQVQLRATARNDLVSYAIAASRGAGFLSLVSLTGLGMDPTNALWVSLTGGSVLEATLYWFLAPRSQRLVIRSLTPTNPWSGSTYFGVYAIANSAQSFDIPLLSWSGGSTAAGSYSAVSRWTQPLGLAAGAFTTAAAPYVASASSFRAAWSRVRGALWLLGIALILCVAAFAFAPQIVPILLGDSYEDSVPVLQIMALGTLPALLNQPLAVFSQMRGSDRPVGIATAIAVAVRLTLVGILGLGLGSVGGAWAYLATQALLLVALVVIFTSRIRAEGEQ